MFDQETVSAPLTTGPVLKSGTFWMGFISCAWITAMLVAALMVEYGQPSSWPALRCLPSNSSSVLRDAP